MLNNDILLKTIRIVYNNTILAVEIKPKLVKL